MTEVVDTIDQPARRAVDEIETARANMEVSSGMLAGKVRMTCSVGMGEYALSPSVTRCLKSQPKVEDIQQVTKHTVDLINSGLEIAMKGLTYFEKICHDESGERCP
ncbi:MAG: hypothetical protein NXH81_12890 [Halieaceae bacterium]|nr:hypothetical protein [Halieaceae bacterium]